jgi:N,N'-diacetyl-8-epilegionaminate cytidylyltransferase
MVTARTIAFVFARGNSKGVPGKNLRLLGDVPLVAHSIRAAQASGVVDRIIVSTDDPDIARAAEGYGAHVPWSRPPELATDEAPEWLAWQHAIEYVKSEPGGASFETFVSLPATAPLRTPDDVARAVELFRTNNCDAVITGTLARRNPAFNMVVADEHGFVRLAAASAKPPARRQDAPVMFDVATVAYVADPSYVRSASGLLAGRVRLLEVAPEHAIDIDSELDLLIAELLWSRLPDIGTRSPL